MVEELVGFKVNGINSGTQTGDGIRMGVEAGAATEGMDNIEYHGVAIPGEDKPTEFLTAVEKGPYYAVVARVSQLCTLGGLKITTGMEVVSTEKEVIPGLYSAGLDCSGSMYNRVYVSYEGVTMGWMMTSGRLAGEAAAAYAAQ